MLGVHRQLMPRFEEIGQSKIAAAAAEAEIDRSLDMLARTGDWLGKCPEMDRIVLRLLVMTDMVVSVCWENGFADSEDFGKSH